MQRGWLDAVQDVFLSSGTVGSPWWYFLPLEHSSLQPPSAELGGKGRARSTGPVCCRWRWKGDLQLRQPSLLLGTQQEQRKDKLAVLLAPCGAGGLVLALYLGSCWRAERHILGASGCCIRVCVQSEVCTPVLRVQTHGLWSLTALNLSRSAPSSQIKARRASGRDATQRTVPKPNKTEEFVEVTHPPARS